MNRRKSAVGADRGSGKGAAERGTGKGSPYT